MDFYCHFASYLLITIVLSLILQVRKLRREEAECLSSLSYQMAELGLDLRQIQSRAVSASFTVKYVRDHDQVQG